jgi:stage IV sporulation protein FB
VKFTIHPLFIAYGVLSAIFGGFPIFIIYALTALLHECGHVFCAERLGFYCERINLTPYGASAVCRTEGILPCDELKLALSGPLVNALMCVTCAGLWWFFPESYAYTDVLFEANGIMLSINLLPAYPLDGGRVAGCFLRKKLSPKSTNIILKISSVSFAFGLCGIFFVYKNQSILVFALFLLTSVFEKDVPVCKINYAVKKKKDGKEMRYILLNKNSQYRDAVKYLSDGRYHVFVTFEDGEVNELYEDELCEMLLSHSIYDRIWG